MVIFDCNGVLVDSEQIAASVAAETLSQAGFAITAEAVGRHFIGRRPSDMLATMEQAVGKKLPEGFAEKLAIATLKRLRDEVRVMPHAVHALSWLRGRKCVASSSPRERIRASLDITGLARFFEPNVFSASDIARGKPAPDLFLYAAESMRVQPTDCIVVEDSPAGVTAATAAGMTPIGFLGGSHADSDLGQQLSDAGARTLVSDMRHLKASIIAIRGW